MILNNTVQQVAMRTFRGMTPIRTGKLRYDAVKLIPIMNYNKFSIYVDAQIAPYGHILEIAETIKYYIGSRRVPKEQRQFIRHINRHYGWITKKAVPAMVYAIATQLGGKVVY